MLKVSAFYLEKQKSFIPKKIFLGRTAKIHPKDGVSRLNFPEGFDWSILQKVLIRNIKKVCMYYLLFHIELLFHNANQRQRLNFPIWIKDKKTVRKLIGGYVDGIFPA